MSFFTELKRRNVFKVGVAYVIVAWLLIQVADVLFPTFQAPDWVMRVFVLFVILGFPLALFLARVYELTPEGIKVTTPEGPAQFHTRTTGQRLNYFIICVLVDVLRCSYWASVLGDPELALEIRRQETRIEWYGLFDNLPSSSAMRRLPGFKDYVRGIGLVDYWRATGKWGDFRHPVGEEDFECE